MTAVCTRCYWTLEEELQSHPGKARATPEAGPSPCTHYSVPPFALILFPPHFIKTLLAKQPIFK